jgi:hypothetical protein
MDYTEKPLTPALSPSEGAREKPRQRWVERILRTPLHALRRVRARGLQGLVGRMRARGVIPVVMYSSQLTCGTRRFPA